MFSPQNISKQLTRTRYKSSKLQTRLKGSFDLLQGYPPPPSKKKCLLPTEWVVTPQKNTDFVFFFPFSMCFFVFLRFPPSPNTAFFAACSRGWHKADLVGRLLREPAGRLKMSDVQRHPLFWSSTQVGPGRIGSKKYGKRFWGDGGYCFFFFLGGG